MLGEQDAGLVRVHTEDIQDAQLGKSTNARGGRDSRGFQMTKEQRVRVDKL